VQGQISVVSSYDAYRLKRTKLPRLNRDKKPCEGFEISLIADIYFDDLNMKIDTLLNGKVANVEGYDVILKEAHIEPSGQNLLVTLCVDGPFRGTLAGIVDLSIDTEKHKVSVSLKEFGVVDGDIELEIANIILGDFVTSELANYKGFEYA
jgi:hypothetical protein